ncbi:hypothetical protein T492DRAFT_593304, partial [Pavlovales sp. CCMP2436]
AFKSRATALEKSLASEATVVVNSDKPRKGCFEVTLRGEDGTQQGEPIISLLDMARPFTKLKALDMDEIAAETKKRLA